MPKLTDEQIVQALDGCIKPNKSYSCAECQYYNKTANCVKNLMKDILDLINRLMADNERLQEENHIYNEANRIIAYQRNQRDKEIVELQKQIKGLHIYENKIKTEAVKEFAERLKEKAFNVTTWNALEPAVTTDVIDNLLKEMMNSE